MGVVRFAVKRAWPATAAIVVAVAIAAVVVRPDVSRWVHHQRAEIACVTDCLPDATSLPAVSMQPGELLDLEQVLAVQAAAVSVAIVPLDAVEQLPVAVVVNGQVRLVSADPGRYVLHVVAQDAAIHAVSLTVRA